MRAVDKNYKKKDKWYSYTVTLAEIKPGGVLCGSYKKIEIIVIMRRRKNT